MRVLVAGGAGFIGSNLCEELLRRGNSVLCVDNLQTGRLANIAGLQGPGFRFLEHDITEDLPDQPPIDVVFHLASPASPPGYVRLPIPTLRANSEGTYRLLLLAAAHRARFVYASTSEVYGDPLVHPQTEEYRGNVSSVGPRSMYDEAKRYGEALTMAFARGESVHATIVRIFNTYGPRSDPRDGRLIPNFMVQALTGSPLTIYGDGSQTRSLCYVDDLVEGLLRSAGAGLPPGEVINLGNPEEHTVRTFAEMVRELLGSSSPLSFVPVAVGDDPARRRPDIEKARRLLGWAPAIALRDGLSRTASYFREELVTTSHAYH